MYAHTYILILLIVLLTTSISAQNQNKEVKASPVPQMKTHVLIKPAEQPSSEIGTEHPATHRLKASPDPSLHQNKTKPLTPDDRIQGYERKLNTLSPEYKAMHPEMVEKLNRLIAVQKEEKRKLEASDTKDQ